MEFRYLESFLAIADELHFGRAAERLHLAQPSLSQQLQRLEKELGVVLVARTSHEVRLTPAGMVFRAEAQNIVERLAKGAELAREAAAGRVGTVRVGFNFPAGQRVLPPTLQRLAEDHPGVLTSLWEKRSGPQLTGLLAGELDVALTFGRPLSARLRSRRLLSLPLVAVVGDGHPWARRAHVPFRELAHQPCVLFQRDQSPAMYDTIVRAAQDSGISLTIAAEVDDTGATGVVVSTRPVVGFASEAVRATQPSARGLSVVPFVDPVPMLSLDVVWRADDHDPLVAAFLDSVETVEAA
ncbi:LysR family transcriptional regulator (plasmid) [Embleya sp. NBC_00888]|uniref:LysR family transcriptional regulator n=1 Tax=Embleya sp. NBC_00888 TaxID=2975960 RepID=UPI002F916685|nr:LysR family transcriptional regulator [Embleya sp. NBC_00888]